jgi:DNA polymerase III epsilon subunit-like protein
MSNLTAIIFDTETTGLIKPSATDINQQPYITELYALKVQHTDEGIVVIGEFESLFKVPVKLSDVITKITGLTNADLEHSPEFKDETDNLAKFFTGSDRLVAHNLAFDRSMLANELLRCDKILNFPWPREHICTVERSIYIEQRRMSLTRLHEHFFNEPFADAHRAKNDVIPLFRCYKEMVRIGLI